jgi:REP-associated tyrosine transposase
VPRKPREEAPGAIHHVIAQGNNGQPIVHDDVDRLVLLRQICRAEGDLGWECLAYCLLDTHIHLVLLTPQPNLGRGMRWLLGGYAFTFNRRHERTGHLFAGPYYAKLIEGESHLVKA